MQTDIIGGFPEKDPNCKGCGKPLTVENAWMTDGCPCNTPLGVNSMNETRWRLLMALQQDQSRKLEALSVDLKAIKVNPNTPCFVLTSKSPLSPEARDRLKVNVERQLAGTNVPLVVLDRDLKLEAIVPECASCTQRRKRQSAHFQKHYAEALESSKKSIQQIERIDPNAFTCDLASLQTQRKSVEQISKEFGIPESLLRTSDH